MIRELSPASVDALKTAAIWARKMFIHHSKERADCHRLIMGPHNWRPPQHEVEAAWARIQRCRADEHESAVWHRDRYNAIMRDLRAGCPEVR
jgi:hypothetical protein